MPAIPDTTSETAGNHADAEDSMSNSMSKSDGNTRAHAAPANTMIHRLPHGDAGKPKSPSFDYNSDTMAPNLLPSEYVVRQMDRQGVHVYMTNIGRKIFCCTLDEYETLFRGGLIALGVSGIASPRGDAVPPAGETVTTSTSGSSKPEVHR